jgi:asparagine synthase (glutamine-hydrolysing)
MCGIGGKISFYASPSPDLGEAMNACMSHRGPDDCSVYSTGPAMLAHRRLSILDLSEAGRQPMSNADESVHIVFNGEIYNYRELRSRVSDYKFTSETDTEVLLHLYEEEGIDCLKRLRGMFAFAIWDENDEELFLARDRMGQKPLFYRHEEDKFWFGSTIKAILADDAVSAKPDLDAIRDFLVYQYTPTPSTGFEGISQLEPATYLRFSNDGVQKRRYWDLSVADQSTASPSQLATQVRDKLKEATRLRMRSDVPVGVFLSGGIDSTVVAGLMSEISETPIETYSIGFGSEGHDEREFARMAADRFETNHHEFTVTPDAMEILPELVEHYEMPFADSSALPTYYVSKMASEDVTVALGGDAGDENYAGYHRYSRDALLNTLRKIPTPLLLTSAGGLSKAQMVSDSPLLHKARRAAELASGDPVRMYARFVTHTKDDQLDAVWNGDNVEDEYWYIRSAYEGSDGQTRLDRILEVDLNTYLPNDLLVKVDRASMAHSLEVRSPFLDHEVVEHAARIPSKYKHRRRTKKWILKRAFEDMLPTKILEREKQGFGIPIHQWFRGQLRDVASENIERLGSRNSFNEAALRSIFDAHISSEEDRGYQLWDYMMLEQWYERFIDD